MYGIYKIVLWLLLDTTVILLDACYAKVSSSQCSKYHSASFSLLKLRELHDEGSVIVQNARNYLHNNNNNTVTSQHAWILKCILVHNVLFLCQTYETDLLLQLNIWRANMFVSTDCSKVASGYKNDSLSLTSSIFTSVMVAETWSAPCSMQYYCKQIDVATVSTAPLHIS
jgi:hypothetical protein